MLWCLMEQKFDIFPTVQPRESPFFSGAELEFKCNEGYQILQSRNKLHNRLICRDTGHWAPPRGYKNPKCIRIQCPPPKASPFGRIVSQVKIYFHSRSSRNITTSFVLSAAQFCAQEIWTFELNPENYVNRINIQKKISYYIWEINWSRNMIKQDLKP